MPRLGSPEDQRTEFKAAQAIKTPEGRRKLAREIVAMLNYEDGGRIFVGIAEELGKASEYDPLGDGDEVHEQALRDVIVDRVDPRPDFERECRFAKAKLPDRQGFVLVVSLSPSPEKRPYCVIDGENRKYLVRLGERIRPMTSDEIRKAVSRTRRDARESVGSGFERLWEEDKARFEKSHEPGHWLRVKPWYRMSLYWHQDEIEETGEFRDRTIALLNSPPPEIARPNGWNFDAERRMVSPREGGRTIQSGDTENGYRCLAIRSNGWLEFRTLLEYLQWNIPPGVFERHKEAQGVIYPSGLIETTVSICRLARKLWEGRSTSGVVVARLMLEGARNWLLPPGSPNDLKYRFLENWRPLEQRDVVANGQMEADRFILHPDALAYELVHDIYVGEFRLRASDIPFFQGEPKRFVHSS